MSLDLKDFRGKITVETGCALEAEARCTHKDQQTIVHELLHAWALEKIRAATVLHRLLQVEGLSGESQGKSGNGGPSP